MSIIRHISLEQEELTGTLGALNATVDFDNDCCAYGTAVFQVSGTWQGKIVVEGAIDGVYNNLSIVQPGGTIAFTGVNNDSQNGVYRILLIAGYTHLRLRMSSYSSGTATIVFNAAPLVPTTYAWQLVPANLQMTANQATGTNLHTVVDSGAIQANFNPANQSAFGTLETNELTPVIQADFIYGLNSQKWRQVYVFTVTDPATDPVPGDIYSNNNSQFTIVYVSGTTIVATGTGDPAASGNLVRVTGSGTDPIAFSAFTTRVGVVFGTGAEVDTNAGRLRIQSGTSSTSFAYITTRRPNRYRAGQGNILRFTPIFTAGVANNIQLWGMGTFSNNAPYDGYFVGYNGVTFSIFHYIAGTPYATAQTAFNGDKLNGSGSSGINLNTAYGTPWMIKYPFLGYGDIFFYAQNPTTGAWILAHTIRYANSSASIQISNPTLNFMGYCSNSGNTSNITTYCGSVGVFISGIRSYVGNPKWAIDSYKTGITTETNLITIKNCNSINSSTNRGLIRIQSISVASTSNTQTLSVFRLKINATLGGTPSFAAINGTIGSSSGGAILTSANSVASYDVAGTTVAGGSYIYNLQCSGSSTAVAADLDAANIFIGPGETLTISGFSTGTAALGVSVNWTEDI